MFKKKQDGPQGQEPKQNEPQKPKPKKTRTDKLVMGAIVGVAVGSVVGMSLKGGHEKHKAQEENSQPPTLARPEHPTPQPRSFLGKLFKRIFSRRKKHNAPKNEHVTAGNNLPYKKIPNELD